MNDTIWLTSNNVFLLYSLFLFQWDNYLNSNLAFFYENSTITPLAQMYMYDDF